MKQIHKRLTYANVMSSIAVFLLIGGGAAFAALGKKSVGTAQLKANAVTTAKIKANAITKKKIQQGAITNDKIADGAIDTAKLADGSVTNPKIADNAINGAKIADGSITNADLNGATTESFTHLAARLRGTVQIPFTGGFQIYPLNNPTYTQPAGRTDQYVGGLEVNFAASCIQPRSAFAYLVLDPENPLTPQPWEIIGQGLIFDKGVGAVTRTLNFGQFASGTTYTGLTSLAPSAPINHTFYILMLSGSCSSGSGVSAVGGGVDVIGTR